MKRQDILFIAIALFSAIVYVTLAFARGDVGFPLDDAWIHQVYARNLATRGEFAFFAGQPSAGSTSPLWAILLSLGYILRLDFRAWAYLLGGLFLGLSAIIGARLLNRLTCTRLSLSSIFYPLFLLGEWHLAWSAVSGMEIPLFVFFSLLLVERFFAGERAWLLGILAGLLTLTRPEGVVLAGLVGIGVLWDADGRVPTRNKKISRLMSALVGGFSFGLGFAILLAPYLAFNFAVSGTFLPNTFYAKNAEYAIIYELMPIPVRWLQLLAVPWIGAQILLLPGFLFIVVSLARRREWRALIPFAWVLLLPALYALRLPVSYQHGRYEMPVVPFILLYGVWGTAELWARIRPRFIRTTWALSVGALVIVFWFVGASAYSDDVAIIQCEMVQTARWVATNTPSDSLIAAHDIGALGYFAGRPMIDLAGLVSPEVIPFIRDEGRLRDYLLSRRATLAIFFPDWYPALASDPQFVRVHQENCSIARDAGGADMMIYRIK